MEVVSDTEIDGNRRLVLRYTDDEKQSMRERPQQYADELESKLNDESGQESDPDFTMWGFNWYPYLTAIDLSTFFTVDDVAELLPAWMFENKNDITIRCSDGEIEIEAV